MCGFPSLFGACFVLCLVLFRAQDPVGELCHGRRLYGALHASLRVLGAITAVRPRVGVTCITFNKEARELELKWTMAANAPFVGQSALKVDNYDSVFCKRHRCRDSLRTKLVCYIRSLFTTPVP